MRIGRAIVETIERTVHVGDLVEIEIEGIGALTNHIVRATR